MRITGAVLEQSGSPTPYAESRPFSVEELELDDPAEDELLIRIEAAGVCHSDLSVVDGNRPRPLPMLLGHEAAGIVEEVGPGVTDVSPGDRVVLDVPPSMRSVLGVPDRRTPALLGGVGRERGRNARRRRHPAAPGRRRRASPPRR